MPSFTHLLYTDVLFWKNNDTHLFNMSCILKALQVFRHLIFKVPFVVVLLLTPFYSWGNWGKGYLNYNFIYYIGSKGKNG